MELYKRRGTDDQELVIIANSEAMQEGAYYTQAATGATEVDDAANAIRGLVVGFRDGKGIPLNSSYEDTDGTLSASTVGNTYTASADNLTDKKVVLQGRPVQLGDVYTGELDATIGTTTGSNVPGYFISVSTAGITLDENTVHATNQLQFRLVDNGEGKNECVHPIRGGNWVLFEVVEVQDVVTQA